MAERYCDVIYGHEDSVRSLGYSPDGTLLVSGGNDGKVRFWNLKKRRCVEESSQTKSSVQCVSFSPDSKHWAVMDREGTIFINSVDGSSTTLKAHPAGKFRWMPDSRHIVASNSQGRVFLYSLQNKTPLFIHRHDQQEVWCLAVSPDGRYIASGANDCLIRLWDVNEGKELNALEGHKQYVRAIAFSPDSKTLGSGDSGCSLYYWNMTTQPVKAQLNFTWAPGEINDVAFSPLYDVFASAGQDGRIKLFDRENGNRRLEDLGATGGHGKQVFTIAFSPCGKYLASGGYDHKIIIWEMKKPSHVS